MADETNSDVSLENSPDQSNSFEYIQQDQSQSDSPNSDDDDHHQDEPHLLKQQTNGQDETQQNGLNGQENSSSSNDDEVEDDESNQEETRQNEVNGQDKSNSSNEEEEEEEEKNEVNSQHKSSSEDEDEEEQEQELKPQREIDNDEIPPAELPNVQKEIRHSPRSSPTQFNENNNNRPLTKLEDPFGTHQEQEEVKEEELSPIETTINETNNSSTNENLLTEKNPLEHPTLSSFLPDVINQTTEQNNIPTETNPSNENPTDSTEVDPKDFTEEDFPPLPKTELPIHQIINDQDFPPLNPPTETTTTTDQQAELEPPLDILKNKSLLKQTLVKGETNTRPSRSTIVTISYSLSLIDSLTSNTRFIEQISNEKYFIGERDLIGAIDVALLSMDRGEKALVESDVRHCYGEQGCEEKQIPPVTTLNPYKMLIEIELHDWTQPIDIQLLSVEERIFWSDKKRLNGNFYYRRQDYKNSLECYQGASRYLDLELNPIDSSIDQNQINLLVEKYIQVQNNLAQTYLLVQKYEDCFNTAANVLKFDPKNVKALFRQGKALFELGKYQEAIQPLKLFLQIQRANPNVDSDKANQMIQISETKLANYQKSEKEIYQRMFRPTTANNQQQQQTKSKKTKQNVHSSDTNWLPYVALGAGALAVLGYIAFTKYHKLS